MVDVGDSTRMHTSTSTSTRTRTTNRIKNPTPLEAKDDDDDENERDCHRHHQGLHSRLTRCDDENYRQLVDGYHHQHSFIVMNHNIDNYRSNGNGNDSGMGNGATHKVQGTSILPRPLQILFFLNGAEEALPVIALSSLVNDRIAVPVSLLPAYYAISFLPYSLKPLYAIMTTCITSKNKSKLGVESPSQSLLSSSSSSSSSSSWCTFSNHVILVILLLLASILLVIKACLKEGQVFMLFVSSFGVSFCVSWAELLVGLGLIDAAKQAAFLDQMNMQIELELELEMEDEDYELRLGQDSEQQEENDSENVCDEHESENEKIGNHIHFPSMIQKRREVYLSVYQSQAATYRNSGSLLAALITFFILFQSSSSSSSSSSEISDEMVTSILFGTAFIPAIAAVVASLSPIGRQSGSKYLRGATTSRSTHMMMHDQDQGPRQMQQNQQQERRRGRRRNGYGRVSGSPTNHDNEASIIGSDALFKTTPQSSPSPSQSPSQMKFGTNEKLFILSVLLFQSLLVIIGLRSLLISYTSNTIWDVMVASLVLGLIVTIFFVSHGSECTRTCSHKDSQQLQQQQQLEDTRESPSRSTTSVALLARVGGYLILRHSIPSTSLVSSYTYGIFRSNVLYLQTMNLLRSVMAVLSSWTYTKKIATKCSSMSGIQKVIVISTIVSGLASCLSMRFIHEFRTFGTNNDKDGSSIENDDGMDQNQDQDQNGDIFKDGGMVIIVLYSLYSLMEGFLQEVTFLPSIVLATNALAWMDIGNDNDNVNDHYSVAIRHEDYHDGDATCMHNDYETDREDTPEDTNGIKHSQSGIDRENAYSPRSMEDSDHNLSFSFSLLSNDSIKYGLLVSCIDFGDQASEFLSVPIIEVLDVRTKDNDWHNLEWYVLVCVVLSIASLLFLFLLRPYK